MSIVWMNWWICVKILMDTIPTAVSDHHGDLLSIYGLTKYLTNRVDLSKMSGFTRGNHIETIVLE